MSTYVCIIMDCIRIYVHNLSVSKCNQEQLHCS